MTAWLDLVLREAGFAGLVVVFAAAGLEYVFPPFPGDSVTVFGGVYAVRAGLPVWLVFGVMMAGSLAGAALAYVAGAWVGGRVAAEPDQTRYLRFIPRESLVAWEGRFRHRARMWLVLNRFLPGIRGPIFFAAGFSKVAWRRVLLWGGVSSLAWNALLFSVGYAVGGQAEKIEQVVSTYSRAVIALLVAMAVAWTARQLWRRRRSRVAPGGR